MNAEIQQPAPVTESPRYSVPWKYMDNWLGVLMLAIINIVILAITLTGSRTNIAQSAWIAILELSYMLPVVLILAWRRVSWRAVGFGKFGWDTMGLGCGLLIGGYAIIILHNGLLYLLGVDTQGAEIMEMFSQLESPVWFFIVGAVVAPLVEEIFFRGFLFQGLRARHGWITGGLLSAAVFAAAHLSLVTLIPTFVLGVVLAYVYHRSNSVWPGVILHFLVNSFGLCSAYFATRYQEFLPTQAIIFRMLQTIFSP